MAQEHHPANNPAQSQPRRVYRSRHNRLIGGVAAGLAEYFHLDAAFMRLIFVACIALAGSGLLGYIIAWIIIPLEPEPASRDKA